MTQAQQSVPGVEYNGTDAVDTITATPYDDFIMVEGGEDLVWAKGGNDTVYGGQGNDTISGGAGNDIIYGGIGNDSISGGGGRDKLDGGTGFNDIEGNGGRDHLIARKGDNNLTGGNGRDKFTVGNGFNTIRDWTPGETIRFNSNRGAAAGNRQGAASVEIDATTQEVVILFEGGGKTHMSGVTDIEAVKAALKDTYSVPVAEPVAPPASSDNGPDYAPFQQYEWVFPESEANHAIFAHNDGILERSYNKLTLLEDSQWNRIEGVTDGEDSLVGPDPGQGPTATDFISNDWIQTGKGNDYAHGFQGNDVIQAGQGNDLVRGGKGNDVLIGGAGDDTVFGGLGNNLFFGGEGADTFLISEGNNVVVDFTAGVDSVQFLDAPGLGFQQTEFGVLATHDLGTTHFLGADLSAF